MLEETDSGQTAEVVAKESMQGLKRGQEMVTSDDLTRLILSTTFGASKRGGFLRAVADWAMGCLGLLILIFVRWDTDRKVHNFGRRYGHLGAKRQIE